MVQTGDVRYIDVSNDRSCNYVWLLALGMRALDELGRVLTHEHLAMDFLGFYVPPPDNLKRFLDGKIQMKTLGYVKQYP